MGPKRVAVLLLCLLILYLSLYTWNLRTGVLDRLAERVGLSVVAQILRPGRWLQAEIESRWRLYVRLQDVAEENEVLKRQVDELALETARLRDAALRAERLEALLLFPPPRQWQSQGARVIAREMGPVGVLESLMVDVGTGHGAVPDMPVATPRGLIGRVLRASSTAATVILINDPNSRIAVMGQKSRTPGILAGQGAREPLTVLYIPVNSPMEVDELLVTSGLGGVFPPGLPVARVSRVERSDVSLFKAVQAEPQAVLRDLEEVLILTPEAPPPEPPRPEPKPEPAKKEKSGKKS